MSIFESEPGKLKGRVMGKTITKPITRTPEYLNSDIEELNETRFHLMTKFESNLYRILVNKGATHSYVGKELLEKILSLDYPISKPTSESLTVTNGGTVEIIGQVIIPIIIGKDVKQVFFRLVPKLRSTIILGTDMIKNLKMILDYDTGTWWLPGNPPTRYQMEARPQSLPRPIIVSVISDKRKATKTSKEHSSEINKNKLNSKIQTSVNNRTKSETKGIENDNKELKPKFGGRIKLKSERENGKTMIERNLNDLNQANENRSPCQKTQNTQNSKENSNKEIPSLFSIPVYNRFQILDNFTLQTHHSNKNQENEEIITTRIFYIAELPEELKNDLSKKLESRKIQTSNGTSDIRNKNSSINLKNKAILLNNIGGKLSRLNQRITQQKYSKALLNWMKVNKRNWKKL